MRKLLTTHGVRLLLAFLCIVAGFASANAVTWTVAGNNTSVFNGKSWDPSATANDMTLSSGTTYTWTSSNFTYSGNIEFKVCKDHGWGEAYPSNNWVINNGTNGKTYKLTITFNSSSHNITVNLAEQTAPSFDATKRKFAVTGEAFGGWNMPPSSAQTFTNNNDGTYTLVYNGATAAGFKLSGISSSDSFGTAWTMFDSGVMGASTLVVGDNNLSTSFGSGNMTMPVSGNVTLTISNVTATSCKLNISGQVQPIEPYATIYIDKSSVTGYIHAWDSSGDYDSWQTVHISDLETATHNGVQYYVFEFTHDGANSPKIIFSNGNGGQTENISVADGDILKYEGDDVYVQNGTTYPQKVYSIAGNNATVFGAEWSATETSTEMEENNGVYSWTSSTFTATSANLEFKIIKNHSDWITPPNPNDGGNYEVTDALPNNQYRITITYNPSNNATSHTLTLVQAAAKAYYVIGDFNSWAMENRPQMVLNNTTGKYESEFRFSGEFKIMDEHNNYLGKANDGVYTITRENPTVTLTTGTPNMNLADVLTYKLTVDPTNNTLTVSGFPFVAEDWYLLSKFDGGTWKLNNSDDKFTYDANSGNYVLIKFISTTENTNFILSKKVASTAEGWNELNGYRYCAANGTDQAITFGTAYPVGQYNDGSYYIPSGKVGTCTFTLNAAGTSLTVTFEELDKNTGHMYIIGRANGGVFQANLGTEMTKIAEGVYQADNVELMSGADFSFTAKLGNDAEDWATANAYRYFAVSTSCFEVTEAMVGSVAANTTGSLLSLQHTGDGRTGANNFMMDVSGAYRITIDINNMKVHFEKMYYDLYMFGKGFTHSGTTISDWDATQAIQMTTTDGNIYHLDAVTFADVEAAGFFFSKVKGASNDNSGKQDIIKSGFVPDTQSGNYLIRRSTEQNDMNKPLKMVAGPTDNSAALSAFNNNRWFIHRGEMAGNNKYNVIVNLAQKTVTIKENVAVQEEMKIRLEQTDNLIGKRPAVRVWITGNDGVITKFEGEWADNANGTHMPGTADTNPGNVTSEGKTFWLDGYTWFKCSEYTSYDNRKWWEWEVGGSEFRIASITFYRNGNDQDNPDDPNGYLSRRSGVLYFTWDEYNNVSEIKDYTTDYYVDHVDEAPECATMLDDHLYVYFVNTPGWDNVYCYAWDTNNQGVKFDPETSLPVNAAWPGDACTIVGYNDDGFAVYRYDFGLKSIWDNAGRTLSGVIFNAGFDANTHVVEEQTGDFVFKNGAIYDYVGRVSLERSLGVIIAKGVVKGPKYEVEDDLIVVYYNPGESGHIDVPYIDEDGHQQIATTNYVGAYYAKDINNANDKSLNYNGKLDYVFDVTQFNAPKPYINEQGQTVEAGSKVQLLMQGRNRYDQSNWVRLVKANDYATANHGGNTTAWDNGGLVGKRIKGEKLAGQIVDNLNPTMIVEDLPADAIQNTTPYVLNDYIAPHFNDDYSVNDNGDLFFVRPKANEVAHITWAVYKGNNEFYTPDSWAGLDNANTADGSTTGDMFNHGNAYNLKGGFKVASWAFAGDDSAASLLEPNQAYQFDAIIRYKDNTSNGAPIIQPQGHRLKEGARVGVDYDDDFNVNNSKFEVYPVNVDRNSWIVTGIDEIETDAIAKEVVAVKYYNIMGVEQRELQPGVNIVVTIYNDGSRSSAKILK